MLNVKKDTESLIEHRDSSSFHSISTDKGSRLSIKFDFDKILWTTEVYASHARNLFKRQVRNQPQNSTLTGKTPLEICSGNVTTGSHPVSTRPLSSAGSDKKSRTEWWQRAMGDLDKTRVRPRGRILLLGTSSSDRAVLMVLLAISCHKEPGFDQLGRYRSAIYKSVIDDVKLLLETLRGLHMELVPGIDGDIFQPILQCDTSGPVHHLNEHILTILTTLWGLPGLLTAVEHSRDEFPERAL
jgi:hypothetical protein